MRIDVSPWIAILSAIWLLFFILGRWQYNRVKNGTTELILNRGRQAIENPAKISVEKFYIQIQPAWETMLKKKAWFITHKSELFPVPAWPRVVQKRLNFTPAWMGAYLRVNGITLTADPQLETEIEHIVSLAPKKRPATNQH